MFKPFLGQCPSCLPGQLSLIPTKRGLCQKHLYEFKQGKKAAKMGTTIAGMKKMGYVKRAIDMTTDWALKADTLFSEWIRRRFADVNGFVKCVLCGDKKHWRRQTCGHLIKRRHLGTRLHDKNAECICFNCNSDMEHNKSLEDSLRQKIVDRHGPGVLDELNDLKNTVTKLSEDDYRKICEELTQKIESL